MNSDRWRRIEELYHAALDRPASERGVFLAAACQEDSELRKEVETLLEQQSGSLLDGPAWEQAPSLMGVPALTPGTQLGPYIIINAVGSGGMGDVYRAKDPRVDRDVAVKISNERFSDRFSREVHAVAALNHPNICHLYDVGPDYLVMELVEGPTLAERIKKGAVPLGEALAIGRQIAEALEAAHEKGIVHRDLKPANIKLTADGKVKVLDFGLAKRQEPATSSPEDSPTLTSTQEGVILGTAAYMSPEQASGKPVDKRADIWAFGAVLWELLTGRRLFEGDTVTQTLAGVLNGEIAFDHLPAETPAAIRGLLRRCLDRDVKNRLRDIGEARIAIDTAYEPVAPAVLPPRSRSPYGWIAAALFAFVLGALAFVHFREKPAQRQRIKFQINPPEGIPLGFQLSPDGRFFRIGTSEGTQVKSWLRSLDDLDWRLVLDRQNGFFALWSWDGENSAFHFGDKLYKFARNGGTPVVLATVPQAVLGGAWLESGVIVLATQSGLFQVSSSGGAPVKIGDLQAGFVDVFGLPVGIGSVAWLPGRRFLYIGTNGTFAGSLDGGKPTQILPDRAVSTYVPPSKPGLPGHLLFLRRETLWAQSFNADRLELQGEAIPIEERVNWFSASTTGVLAFQHSNSQDRVLTWLDRTGKRLRSVSKPFRLARDPAIRLSPNDSQAIVPIDGRDGPDLWIADLNRNTLSKFTFNGSSSGLWSPDGRKVLWAANDGNRYLRSADGSGSDELLFKNPTCDNCFANDWSSDERFVAFSGIGKVDEKQVLGIWIMPTKGDRKPYPYLQSRFLTLWAQFSPDNRWMAYVSDLSPSPAQIFVESIPTGKGRWQISTETGDWPIWSRDGKELFYIERNKLMMVPTRLSETSVEIGNPVELFRVPVNTRFQVSRDGQRFLMALPVEGSPSTQITVDTDWRAGLKQ